MGRLVAIHIGCGVGHRGRSNRERVAGRVITAQIGNATVVISTRLVPVHDRLAGAGVIGNGDIRGAIGDGRCLIIGNGHGEGSSVHIATDVGGGVGHQSISNGERSSGGVAADNQSDTTIVGDGRLCPGCGCGTSTLEGTDREISAQSVDGRQLGVDIHFADVRNVVSVAIEGAIGDIAGVRNPVSFTVLLDSRKDVAGVRNVVAVAIRLTAILQLTLVRNQVIVTVRRSSEGDVTDIGSVIVIAVKGGAIGNLAGIKDLVGVAVVCEVKQDITSVQSSIFITVGGAAVGDFAAVRNLVVVAISVVSGTQITLIQKSIGVAVCCGSRRDLTTVFDIVLVAVRFAIVRNLVVVAVVRGSKVDIAGVDHTVEVAVRLRSVLQLTGIRDSVQVAIRNFSVSNLA